MTEGQGLPIGLAVSGANTHDSCLVEETIKSMPVSPPDKETVRQNMCMDKPYDSAEIRVALEELGYVPHVRTRGEERKRKRKTPRYRARRWVCERTHSWMNRFRRILIRWEKKVANYEAMLQLACAYICLSAAQVLG